MSVWPPSASRSLALTPEGPLLTRWFVLGPRGGWLSRFSVQWPWAQPGVGDGPSSRPGRPALPWRWGFLELPGGTSGALALKSSPFLPGQWGPECPRASGSPITCRGKPGAGGASPPTEPRFLKCLCWDPGLLKSHLFISHQKTVAFMASAKRARERGWVQRAQSWLGPPVQSRLPPGRDTSPRPRGLGACGRERGALPAPWRVPDRTGTELPCWRGLGGLDLSPAPCEWGFRAEGRR